MELVLVYVLCYALTILIILALCLALGHNNHRKQTKKSEYLRGCSDINNRRVSPSQIGVIHIFNMDNFSFHIQGVGISGVNIGINSNCSIEGYGNIILNITNILG